MLPDERRAADVAATVGENGSYENISEHVRSLFRRDKKRAGREASDRLKAELTRAFAEPKNSYKPLSAAEIIARNRPEQMNVRIQAGTLRRLDDIYRYRRDRWSEAQADRYITAMFEAFERIEVHGVVSRPAPAKFAVEGFVFRYECHFIYRRRLSNGDDGLKPASAARQGWTAASFPSASCFRKSTELTLIIAGRRR